MTTYSAITAAEIDADSPITDTLMGKMRDNPVAITEGAAGAPRIQYAAMASAANSGLAILTVSASDDYDLGEGAMPSVGALSTGSIPFVVGHTWTVSTFTGSIRFRWTHTTVSHAGSSELRKNGTAVFSAATPGNTAVGRVTDISIVAGDVITLWHQTAAGGGTSSVSTIFARATNAYVAKTVWGKAV